MIHLALYIVSTIVVLATVGVIIGGMVGALAWLWKRSPLLLFIAAWFLVGGLVTLFDK